MAGRPLSEPDPESFLPPPRDTFHILVSLADRERHGYSVMLDVAERTNGALRLSPSTLYASIPRRHDQNGTSRRTRVGR